MRTEAQNSAAEPKGTCHINYIRTLRGLHRLFETMILGNPIESHESGLFDNCGHLAPPQFSQELGLVLVCGRTLIAAHSHLRQY